MLNGHDVPPPSTPPPPTTPDHLLRGTSVMLEGTLPTQTQALSLGSVRTPSFKDGYFGAAETQGGAVHTCVPVTFSVPGLGC